jgi:hypothetical protein
LTVAESRRGSPPGPDVDPTGSSTPNLIRPKRWAVVVLVVLGVALILMPAVFQIFQRAPKGAAMIAEFRPFMSAGRLNGFQTDVRQVNAGVVQANQSVAAFLESAATAHSGAQSSFDATYPTFADFAQQWGGIDSHMTSLLDSLQANLGNYQAVAALPSFRLFPWFFVAPGVIVLILAGLVAARPRRWRSLRWVFVALGVALVLSPVVFQMFQRAPKGGEMMSAFKTIETTSNVENIQGYFGNMAVGQGEIRLDLVPALEKDGLSPAEVRTLFPAVATLDSHWVHILNDMTPMIRAMSNNVANYQAIAALPPFALFPYFFVLPGLLITGTAIVAGSGRKRLGHRSTRPSEVVVVTDPAPPRP